VHFSLKIWHLVATISVIFHWGNISKVAFLAITEIFGSSRGHGPSDQMVNTPMDTHNGTLGHTRCAICKANDTQMPATIMPTPHLPLDNDVTTWAKTSVTLLMCSSHCLCNINKVHTTRSSTIQHDSDVMSGEIQINQKVNWKLIRKFLIPRD